MTCFELLQEGECWSGGGAVMALPVVGHVAAGRRCCPCRRAGQAAPATQRKPRQSKSGKRRRRGGERPQGVGAPKRAKLVEFFLNLQYKNNLAHNRNYVKL